MLSGRDFVPRLALFLWEAAQLSEPFQKNPDVKSVNKKIQ